MFSYECSEMKQTFLSCHRTTVIAHRTGKVSSIYQVQGQREEIKEKIKENIKEIA